MKKVLITSVPVLFMLALLVMPVSAATLPYDETVEVDAFSFHSITFEINELGYGTDLSISLEVVSGNDISFFICNGHNFNKWVRGASVVRHAVREDVVSASIEWTVPETEMPSYVFVLDNTDSGEKVTVHLTIVEAAAGGTCLGTLLIAAIPIVALVILGKRLRGGT